MAVFDNRLVNFLKKKKKKTIRSPLGTHPATLLSLRVPALLAFPGGTRLLPGWLRFLAVPGTGPHCLCCAGPLLLAGFSWLLRARCPLTAVAFLHCSSVLAGEHGCLLAFALAPPHLNVRPEHPPGLSASSLSQRCPACPCCGWHHGLTSPNRMTSCISFQPAALVT